MAKFIVEPFEVDSLLRSRNLLSIRQASKLLKVNYYTIYRLIVNGAIHAFKVGGVWRVPYEELVTYLTGRHTLNLSEEPLQIKRKKLIVRKPVSLS